MPRFFMSAFLSTTILPVEVKAVRGCRQLGNQGVVIRHGACLVLKPLPALEPQLISQPRAVLSRSRRLAYIDASHRQAKLLAAVVDPSAQANDIDQNFAWPGIVWCRVVLGLDLPSGGPSGPLSSSSSPAPKACSFVAWQAPCGRLRSERCPRPRLDDSRELTRSVLTAPSTKTKPPTLPSFLLQSIANSGPTSGLI